MGVQGWTLLCCTFFAAVQAVNSDKDWETPGQCYKPGTANSTTVGVRVQCVCRAGFVGDTCHLGTASLETHPHGRYVGPVACVKGTVVDNRCQCDAGYEGYHCGRRACTHGVWKCAGGSEYCLEAACVCASRNAGPECHGWDAKMSVSASASASGSASASSSSARVPHAVTENILQEFLGRLRKTGGRVVSRTEQRAQRLSRKQATRDPEDPRPCHSKKCANVAGEVTGTFNATSCSCDCMAGWSGQFCDAAMAPEVPGVPGVPPVGPVGKNATEAPVAMVAMDEDLGAPASTTRVDDPSDAAKGTKGTKGPTPQRLEAALSSSLSAMSEGGATGLDAPLSAPALNASVLGDPSGLLATVATEPASNGVTMKKAPQPGSVIMPPQDRSNDEGGRDMDEAPVDVDADLLQPGAV